MKIKLIILLSSLLSATALHIQGQSAMKAAPSIKLQHHKKES